MPLPGTVHGQGDPFTSTQWSVVIAAGESQDAENAQAALAQLCQTYWAPLYTFVRSRGYGGHDAQDLTQSFFAYLIEKRIYAQVDPQKGKFRSFLLGSLKNFLANAYDREQSQKRGGGQIFLPLHEEQVAKAESLYQTHDANGVTAADRMFDRAWAETFVATAFARLSEDYKSEGKEKLFEELKSFLMIGVDSLPTYEQLATRLGAAESTLRSHVTRMRARYREALRAEARRTVQTEAEVNEELREFLRVLTGR